MTLFKMKSNTCNTLDTIIRPCFRHLCASILVLVLSSVSSRAAVFTWDGGGLTDGNWSDPDMWEGGVVPPSDGTADIHFSNTTANANSRIDAAWSTNGSVNSLTFDYSNRRLYLRTLTDDVAYLAIGAGGLVHNNIQYSELYAPLKLNTSQTWHINAGNFRPSSKLIADPGTLLTFGGTDGAQIAMSDPDLNSELAANIVFDQTDSYIVFGRNGSTNAAYAYFGTNSVRVTGRSDFDMEFDSPYFGEFTSSLIFGADDTHAATNLITLYLGDHGTKSTGIGNSVTFLKGLYGKLGGCYPKGNSSDATGGGIKISNFDVYQQTTGDAGLESAYTHKFKYIFSGSGDVESPGTAANTNLGALISVATVVLDNPNAFGISNSLATGIGVWQTSEAGQLSSLLATDGNDVAAPIRVFAQLYYNRPNRPMSEIGLYGSGTNEFSGDIYLEKGPAPYYTSSFQLFASQNAYVKVSGMISDVLSDMFSSYGGDTTCVPLRIHGGSRDSAAGVVELSGTNTYAGQTAVRSGTLIIGNNQALGLSTHSVLLGDVVRDMGTVRVASTMNLSGEVSTSGVWPDAPDEVDGVTLDMWDRVLVKDRVQRSKYNGVYEVTNLTPNVWRRIETFDEDEELRYGSQFTVLEGTNNAGKRFFLPPLDTNTQWTINSYGFLFHEDAVNPNVALLANADVTITNNIIVTDNNSTGASSIGSTNAVTATFTGEIGLERDVTLCASVDGTAIFEGDITGTNTILIGGTGVVKLSGNKSYTGATEINEGLLQVDGTLQTPNVTFGGTGGLFVYLAEGSTTCLSLNGGDVNLNNGRLIIDVEDAYQMPGTDERTIIAGAGSVSGEFESGTTVNTSNGQILNITYNANSVVVFPSPVGTMIIIK